MAARRSRRNTQTGIVPIGEGSLPDYSRHRGAVQRQAASTPTGGGVPRIGAGQGGFTFPGQQYQRDKFFAVVLCALRANRWTEGPYDPKNPRPPDCVAVAPLGTHENEMTPTEGWPKRQAESCAVCPQNVRGQQKRCRNGIDVLLVGPSDSLEGVAQVEDWEKAPILCHTISATGIQPWGVQVVAPLTERGIPLFGAVLEFRSVKEKTWYKTVAQPAGVLPPAIVDTLAGRVEEAERMALTAAQPVVVVDAGEANAAPPPPRRRKKAGKKSGRRKL